MSTHVDGGLSGGSSFRRPGRTPIGVSGIPKVIFLQELIEMKHGDLTVDLNHAEIQEIIDHISTS